MNYIKLNKEAKEYVEDSRDFLDNNDFTNSFLESILKEGNDIFLSFNLKTNENVNLHLQKSTIINFDFSFANKERLKVSDIEISVEASNIFVVLNLVGHKDFRFSCSNIIIE